MTITKFIYLLTTFKNSVILGINNCPSEGGINNMDFLNNHKFFDKLEYNVCKKKECFTLTNTSLNFPTKKEQDFLTLFLHILNLTDPEFGNLDKHLEVLNHVVKNNNNYDNEKLLINKTKQYLNNNTSIPISMQYDVFKIACQYGYFKQISPIEYYDINNSTFKVSNVNDIKTINEYCQKNKIKKIAKYEINNFEDFIVASLSELFKNHRVIMKCENCGKYFLPLRNDAKYCSNPSPQDYTKTCKKIMPELNYNDSLIKDKNKLLHRKILKNLNKNVHREEFDYYKKKTNKYKDEFKLKKDQLNNNEITQEDFSNWLQEMNSK